MIADAFRRFKHRRRLARAIVEINARPEGAGRPHGLNAPLIVSLTSYPPRFPTLALTLRSLSRQSVQPDRIILWLDAGDDALLPRDVTDQSNIEIRICPPWRSFKKLVPTVQLAPDAYVVTADDDVYYPVDWLKKLADAAQSGATVACLRAHRVVVSHGAPEGYESWQHNLEMPETGPLVFPTGVSGVIYAPNVFHADVTRDDLFMKLAPSADDIWLYWMHRLQGSKPVKLGQRARILEWAGTQSVSLRATNRLANEQGGNDRAIAALMKHYGWPS